MTDDVPRFTNPVLAGDRPDPAIIRVGDEYWMTYSSFESAPGLPLYRSTDLVNWAFEGSALAEPLGNTFAVDIAEHDGRFFIYIPFIPTPWSTLTDASIFVIHAPSMSGPWSDPIDLGIRGAIDPGHVVGEDGRRYLFVSGIRRIGLADDGLSTVGELEQVYGGWRYPDEWVTEAYALEGPKLFQRDGWFYLVSAVGGTAGPPTGHMVIVARSRSVHGPWENSPRNPIARTRHAAERWWSRGHATILHGPADAWWMVSHGYEHGFRTLGRQVLLEPIAWTTTTGPSPPRSTSGRRSRHRRMPRRSARHRDSTRTSRPSASASGGPSTRRPRARRVGSASTTAWSCARRGAGPADTSPLCIPTGDHSYEVEVDVEVSLDSGTVEGGLLLFFNNRLFCGMGIDGERMLSYSGGIRTHWREPAAPARRMSLRIRNDAHIVTGWYRLPGDEWVRHGVRYETSGYHANTAGDLLSLRPAIYAAGVGDVRFRDFRYTPLG